MTKRLPLMGAALDCVKHVRSMKTNCERKKHNDGTLPLRGLRQSNVVTDTQIGGLKYDYLKGAVGTAILGAGGAAAGMKNQQQQVFKCPDCGMTLSYAMPEEIKQVIDLGVMSLNARAHLKLRGSPIEWEYLTSKFKILNPAVPMNWRWN